MALFGKGVGPIECLPDPFGEFLPGKLGIQASQSLIHPLEGLSRYLIPKNQEDCRERQPPASVRVILCRLSVSRLMGLGSELGLVSGSSQQLHPFSVRRLVGPDGEECLPQKAIKGREGNTLGFPFGQCQEGELLQGSLVGVPLRAERSRGVAG